MYKFATLAALAALVPLLVSAQAERYAQCGGVEWTGQTTCVSGARCVSLNPQYSHCAPEVSARSADVSENPYTGYDIWVPPHYASQVRDAAALIEDPVQREKALKITQVPTFAWFDTIASVSSLDGYLRSAKAQQESTGKKVLVQIIIYNMPNRDCAAAASSGEIDLDGVNKYKDYIHEIAAIIKRHPSVRVVAIVEPDSLPNLVTNMSIPKCAAAAAAYKDCTLHAVRVLNEAGVYMYLDGAHSGWLGWPGNIDPAVEIYAGIYNAAGKPRYLRGISTNISNFNALRSAVPDPATDGNPNYDESRYVEAFAPKLAEAGFPARFIVDQGRSGVQNIRPDMSSWCNLKGAGFGMRPGADTGSPLIDYIVWAKPGAQSDGTSDTSSPRFDENCGRPTALQPAPEAGQWFQAYFEMLVKNANPEL